MGIRKTRGFFGRFFMEDNIFRLANLREPGK